MIKKTLTYKDFTGEEQTEEFHFHLTEADLVELELSAEGNSLSAWTKKIVKSQNGAEIIATFKKLIAVSYGIKSDDGRRFKKSEAILDEFRSTMAYSKLFMELATDAEKAAEFVNGIMPEDMPQDRTAGLTASEAARKRSEEALTGRQAKAEKPVSTVERQPDLPVVVETAPPVLEPQPNASNELPPVTPEAAVVDLANMSSEELRELVLRQQADRMQPSVQ